MTTAREVIHASFEELRIIAAEEEPTAWQAARALFRLNLMLHGLKSSNADLQYQDIGLDDSVPLPPEHIDHVVYMLAYRLAAQFGTRLTPEVSLKATDATRTMRAAYRRIGRLKVDPGILSNGSRRYNVETDS